MIFTTTANVIDAGAVAYDCSAVTHTYNHASRSVLNRFHLERFPGETLFDRIARAVCRAECLPRKELYEAWEVARRVRRRFRGGPVVDLAAGHGLLAHILILLDDTTPYALCVDRRQPQSADKLNKTLVERWPRLDGRIRYEQNRLEKVALPDDALVVSVHACGTLTDKVLDLAIDSGSRVAVLPCCHALKRCDTGGVDGWVDGPLAVDLTRAARLRQAGFQIHTQTIPGDVTPMNRLLMGRPT